jgi:hypothetical protein
MSISIWVSPKSRASLKAWGPILGQTIQEEFSAIFTNQERAKIALFQTSKPGQAGGCCATPIEEGVFAITLLVSSPETLQRIKDRLPLKDLIAHELRHAWQDAYEHYSFSPDTSTIHWMGDTYSGLTYREWPQEIDARQWAYQRCQFEYRNLGINNFLEYENWYFE